MRSILLVAALGLSGCVVVPVGEGGVFSGPLTTSNDAQFEDETPGVFDETAFLALVNDERGNVSAQPVVYNDLLSQAAQAHAEDMVENDYFSHIGLDGSEPGDRVDETGYQWEWLAENLFQGSTKETAAIETWINSDSHRDAMLEERAQEIGVGIEDTIYVLILADPL